MAIKVDLNKAYDRICWDFLIKVLERMGFSASWIGWVKECVCSIKYSITANGEQVCNTVPSRGLRQGDPLSPYLFLIASNVLSILINKAILKKSFVGIRLRRKCPIISHLLFADDSLVFLEAKTEVCSNFKDLVMSFNEASGLSINFQKSSLFFSANTNEDMRNEIKDIFGMEVMTEGSKYLGLPMFWGRSKKEAMAFIKDKILGKIHGWNSRTLPQASKEVLIKSVIQATPMYPMMCFKLPSSLCSSLNSIIGKFWWENGDGGGKIHWGSWEKLTEAKGNGGMGFRDLEAFNCALLAKQFWRMMQTPNAYWVQVLKGIYFPNSSCMEAGKGANPSWLWSGLLEGKATLQQGLRWNVGNGNKINFWSDNWIPNWSSEKPVSSPPPNCQ